MEDRYRDLLTQVLEGIDLSARDVHAVERDIEEAVFGEEQSTAHGKSLAPPKPAEALAVLDLLAALAHLEPDDSAHVWTRAGRLAGLGSHLEAASEYLRAAGRFDDEFAAGTGLTGDEDSWAESAQRHAAREFARAGHYVTAALVARALAEPGRREIAELIRAELDD